MKRLVLPGRFPIGCLLHRHAVKVERAGIDMLNTLHAAERYVSPHLRRPLSDAERCRFREAIRDANRHSARRAAEDRQQPRYLDTYA